MFSPSLRCAPFGALALSTVLIVAPDAHAEGVRFHVEGGMAYPMAGPQNREMGGGGGGSLEFEYRITQRLGLGVRATGVMLSTGSRPLDPKLAQNEGGNAVAGLLGVRATPLDNGLWLDGSFGLAHTGVLMEPAVDLRVGYDVTVGGTGPVQIGPFVGYTQIFQPDTDLRPEDARIAWLGLHIGFDPSLVRARNPLAPTHREAPTKTEPMYPQVQFDHDGIVSVEHVCPGSALDGATRRLEDDDAACPPPAPPAAATVDERIVLDTRLHFATGSSAFGSNAARAREALRTKVVVALDANVVELRVEGHADDVGDGAYNQTLSEARAQTVKRALEELGVQSELLVIEGFGETRPRFYGVDAVARGANRRVELVMKRRAVTAPPPPAESDAAPLTTARATTH